MRAPAIFASAIFTSLFILSSSEILAASPADDSSRIEESGWRTLTKRNFSSEIRRHPRLLLIVTVPWSGESRSLMKEVSHMVTDRQDEHGYLKLRVVYRNSEKMLADILGATEEITIFYYHQSTSYKYQGHLRARNILSSIYQFSTLRFEETFLETLQTQDDIESFSQSTDNAVLLLEFCGWSAELLHEQDFTDKRSDNAGILGDNVTREANGTLAFDKKNQKEWEDEELTCRADNGFTVDSWHTEFTLANQSASQAAESRHTGNEGSCTFEAFQQLPEFLNCSIVFQEGDDHRVFIRAHNPFVTEVRWTILQMNKLPSIYMMDCTENDCGPLLKSIGKKEQYPALMLFPAENKSAISYEGDVSVVSIIEFLASQGSNSQYLNRHKGFLWNHNLKGRKKRTTLTDASSFSVDVQRLYSKDKYTEIHVDDNHVHVGSHTPGTIPDQSSLPIDEQTPSTDGIYAQFVMGLVGEDTHHSHGSHTSRYSHDNVVPGTILAATDKLQNSYPFDNSTIVIVRADQNHGFQGVIINKHLSWDVFKGSEEPNLLRKAPLFFGGPVRAEGAPLVSLTRKPIEGFTEVETSIYFGDPSTTNIAIELIISGNCSAEDYSFFLGYSSWGWNQLFGELEEGAWLLTTARLDI